jgi:hypothetical protein
MSTPRSQKAHTRHSWEVLLILVGWQLQGRGREQRDVADIYMWACQVWMWARQVWMWARGAGQARGDLEQQLGVTEGLELCLGKLSIPNGR